MPVIQRTGAAEIILAGESVATGIYEVMLDQIEPSNGATRHATARGVIRLRVGESAQRAMAGRSVQVRFNRSVELPVEVTLYVPGAGFIAFTCPDASSLVDE